MTSFKTRIKKLSKEKSKIILANDYDSVDKLTSKTIKNIKTLNKYICAIKINFHLLLPLDLKELKKINCIAHEFGLETIADIKLNDIGNTNKITTDNLWKCGFDAVIVNPIMGIDSLKNLIRYSHKKSKGVITLCHMSAPEASKLYEIPIIYNLKQMKLYQLFLKWALSSNADGIIVGATFPKVIEFCKKQIKNKLDIYSPGIGTQGGNIQDVLGYGSDFVIVGRTIINAKNPIETTKKLYQECV